MTEVDRAHPGEHIAIHAEPLNRPWSVFTSKPVLAALLVGVVAVGVEFTPLSSVFRPLSPHEQNGQESGQAFQPRAEEQRTGEAELEQETVFRPELAQPESVKLPTQPRGPIAEQQGDFSLPKVDAKEPPLSIDDPQGSLDGFYRALGASARKEPNAITRIVYHGDSLVASDYVTATLRRKLQAQFGDAGHGFVLIANAWPAYFHNDVFRYASRGWKVSRIVGPYAQDGFYGLGGVSFAAPPGVRARFGTAEKGEHGRNVSLFEIAYLKQPAGGEFEIRVDGEFLRKVSTKADTARSGFESVKVEDGEHLLEIVTKSGQTRLFGVVLEREHPGVVLDAIGIQGARIRFLDKQDDAHWAEQLAWRKPQLIVYQFGANESGDGFAYSMEDYHRTMKEVLLQAKRAVPEAGCLIVAAMDRARKVEQGMITVPIIPHIVKEQESTAKEVGCAFWNTFKAMGGHGSMAQWVRRGLGQADLTHPTGVGAEILGNWIYRALIEGYENYRQTQSRSKQ